ncbi:MAG: Acylphosphatase [Chlamydiae bacterium]|nr:Acylphosphatase [Chlamydiota bacterium]
METIHIIVKGNVQGVGYRATVEYYAKKLNIKGSVKNLENGSVEIYAQSDKLAVDQFIESIQKGKGLAQVKHVSTETCQVQKEYQSFEILF